MILAKSPGLSHLPFVGRVRDWAQRWGGGVNRPHAVASEQHSILDPRGGGAESRIMRWLEPDALADAHQFDRLAREGYRLHSVARACVDEIATSASEPRFVAQQYVGKGRWETIEPIGQGPTGQGRALARLLRDPCGDRKTSWYDFMLRAVTDYQIFGNTMLHKIRGQESGTLKCLEFLRIPCVQPDRARPGDRVRTVTVNRYLDQSLVTDPRNAIQVKVDDILHWKMIDPLDDFWGLPPMASCLEDIDLDQKAHEYLRKFFYNAGVPSGLLKLKGVTRPEQRRAIQFDWMQRYSGGNAHKVAVLDQDAEYQELGTRPDKLKLEHVFDISESRICSSFHIPPIIIGVRIGLSSSTYSNYQSARTSFWRETLSPMYVQIAELLTMQIAWEFGEEYRIYPDFTNVVDLQEAEDTKRTWAMNGYEKGVLTRDEARLVVGLDPKGEDTFKTKSSDGKPYKPGEIPNPNPEPKKLPGAAPAKPTRNDAPGTDAGAAPGLHLLGTGS